MKHLLVLLAVAIAPPALASNPGQPLDCSDIVVLEPGLSLTTVIPFPCPDVGGNLVFGCRAPSGGLLDNTGGFFYHRTTSLGLFDCGTGLIDLSRYEIYRFRAGQDQLIAYLDERCGATPGCRDEGYVRPAGFDDKNGNLFIEMGARPNGPGQSGQCDDELPNYPPYPNEGGALCSLAGFTTTFEILQTYEPTANEISFRVPYMPEGFQYADYFDTYWGDLATVGDWSQAQPLQCGYPASSPSVGDFLTVEDNLPELGAGQGRYYVTTVHHQGQTRYGRKSSGGVLTGRDPAMLPGCEP